MNILQIQTVPTKMAASLEIIAMLLVTGIISFFTAWFYAKSVNRKRIDKLESIVNDYTKKIDTLDDEKSYLQKTLKEKENLISYLTKEVNVFKTLNSEAVHKTKDLIQNNKETAQLLTDKDAALKISSGTHLVDYSNFGTATKEEKDDLKMISGIGPFFEERLNELDIFTFRQISKFSEKDIETIEEAIEYFSGRIKRDEWIAQASELLNDKEKQNELLQRISAKKQFIRYDRIGMAKKEEANDLTEISGIGGWINEKLNALDIFTFKQISNFNDEDVDIVTEAIEFFPGRIERDEWIHQARELIRIEISKSEHFKRISVMKNRIYYDRLGEAHKHHANNLTQIKGISLWMEESLNMLEIYTFKQLSNLTPEDIVIVSDILEISPNRINQDNWVGQASLLANSDKKMNGEVK